jgi:hypothetical protein
VAAAPEKKVIGEVKFDEPIYATPVAANGRLYVTTSTHLYAIQAEKPVNAK